MARAPGFPAMKARKLESILRRRYGYGEARQNGSHRVMESTDGYPRLTLAFGSGTELGGAMVRQILTRQVRLTLEEARDAVADR